MKFRTYCYPHRKALGWEFLHGGLHGTRLFWSTRHPQATIRLEEEHGILCFAHRFKKHILHLLKEKQVLDSIAWYMQMREIQKVTFTNNNI